MPTSWTTCAEPAAASFTTCAEGASAAYTSASGASGAFEECAEASLGGSFRTLSSKTDFSVGGAYGGSLSARTDAVASRKTSAYAPGPEALDSSTGTDSVVWRLASTGTQVVLSVASGSEWSSIGTIWSAATPDALSFCFDRSGGLHATMEAEGSIWAYYLDTLSSATTLRSLASGRDPIAVVDDISSDVSADALIFWVASNGSLLYAQQRQRYQSILTTPFSLTSRQRLEVGGRVEGSRLAFLVSEWSTTTHQWGLSWIFTAPFPVRWDDTVAVSGSVSSGRLYDLPSTQAEPLGLRGSFRNSLLRDVLRFYVDALDETVGVSGAPSGGTMRDVVRYSSSSDILGLSGGPRSTGTLTRVITYYSNATNEPIGLRGGPSSGTFDIP